MDWIIRGGRIVDGSGLPAFEGDVALKDGKVVRLGGRIEAEGAKVFEAKGCVVAPGFIDPHTHFDVQLLWDGQARPALEHGVTTIVPGNCSLSLAPLKADDRKRVVGMFQQIEEMPDAAFDGAFAWRWESFDGYLAALKESLSINVAPLVGHSVIRLWVMGAAATERAANAEELAAMQDLLAQCLDAGAVGLSTSFVDVDENLQPVPSRYAHFEELDALAAVLGRYGRMLQVVPEFYATDLTLARVDQLAELSLRYGIPTTFSPLFDSAATPENVPRVMARGAQVWPQVQTRPIDISFTFETASLLFAGLPKWYRTLRMERDAKITAFSDPAWVAELLAEAEPGGNGARWAGVRVRGGVTDRALVGQTLGALAEADGTSPAQVMIKLSLEEDLKASFIAASLGHNDSDRVGALLADAHVHVGASDAGAHIQSFATYGDTGYLLGHFVRDCGALSLEAAIKKITADTARIWGLPGRGQLAPGFAADVAIFDAAEIDRCGEEAAFDMPEEGMRYVRASKGMVGVFVNGELSWSKADGYAHAPVGEIATQIPGAARA